MTEQNFDSKDVESNKVISSFAYLWVLFLIPILFGRKSTFAQINGNQGFILFVFQAVTSLFVWVPFVGPIINLVTFFLIPIIAITRTLTGKFWPIPLIHKYAEKISFG